MHGLCQRCLLLSVNESYMSPEEAFASAELTDVLGSFFQSLLVLLRFTGLLNQFHFGSLLRDVRDVLVGEVHWSA